MLIPFCEAGSISARDPGRAVRKRVIVSLSFVNKDRLHQALFDNQHLDWAGVQDYLSEASYSCSDWLQILSLLDFVDEVPPTPAAADLIATAAVGMRIPTQACADMGPLDTMRLCCAKAKINALPWDTLCKALILCNLTDVDLLASLQALLLAHRAATQEQASEVVRHLPSYRHTQEQYTDTFAAILHESRCQTRSHVALQSLREHDLRREMLREQAARVGQGFQKPSLTAFLEAKRLREGSALASQDSLAAFCGASKISANASSRLKQVAYYLACLPDHPDKPAQLARAVGGDLIVQASIQAAVIVKPDIKALRAIIADSHHTGAPFDSLRKFREVCIASSCMVVTASGRRMVHWSTVFRLYLAAYCRQEIYKVIHILFPPCMHSQGFVACAVDFYAACAVTAVLCEQDLWTHVINSSLADASTSNARLHTAPETESTVQAFVKQNPMALEEAVTLMLQLSSSS